MPTPKQEAENIIKARKGIVEAIYKRMNSSYGIDQDHVEIFPSKNPKYHYEFRVVKWTSVSNKVTEGYVRWDAKQERWIVSFSGASGWMS